MTQSDRILELLESRECVSNRELNQICFRYGARIHDLRKAGHDIRGIQVKRGLWKFWLVKEPIQMELI